jgi:hypothetical protein
MWLTDCAEMSQIAMHPYFDDLTFLLLGGGGGGRFPIRFYFCTTSGARPALTHDLFLLPLLIAASWGAIHQILTITIDYYPVKH